MKMNPNSPKHQASIRRWNTYQARKRLERKVQTCFAPDSRFCIHSRSTCTASS